MSLEAHDREVLLKLARRALEHYFTGSEPPPWKAGAGGALEQGRGVFVSIYCKETLRGCIGVVETDKPLGETVQRVALEAATQDSRFPPLQKEELPDVTIEISVLSRLVPIQGPQDVRIGRDGLCIRKGPQSGLLLPQVAQRHSFGPEEFLRQVCRKAGLDNESWKANRDLFRFQAEVFGEGQSG